MNLPDCRNWFRTPEYARYELFLIRGLFSLVIWDAMPGAITIPSDPHPVGLGHWIDFGFLAHPQTLAACRWLLLGCLILYSAGFLLFLALPIILLLLTAAGTINASFGATTHSKQIIVLCVLAQCAWYVYTAIRRRKVGLAEHRFGAFAGVQAIAAAYVISGISKLFGDGNWLIDAVKNFQIQATKNQRMKYYNTLSEETAETGSGLQGVLHTILSPILSTIEYLLLNSPAWRALFLGGGFMLELFAFLALIGRKMSLLIGGSLILFHLTVFEIMGLRFRYNIYLLLIFLIGVPYWTGVAWRRLKP
ncbi:MAG: hypothetical protein ACR2RV_13700 [Verrucomicrobiales bacterium]